MATPQRKPGREHIPLMPTGFIALRIIQLVVAVIVLALVSYSIHFLAWDGNAFMLAVAIMTIISSIYHLIAWFGVPEAYNYWAILGLDITLIVLWLAAFAVVAARIAPWMEYYGAYLYSLSTYETAWWTGLAASSGLGGLEFALHIVSLVIHSIRLHRHRKEGGHCTPGVPFGPKPTTGTMQVPQGQQVVYAVPMVQGVVMPQQQQQQVYQQPQQQQMYQQPQAQGERPQGPPVYQQQPVQGLVYQQQQPPQQVYAPQPQQPQQVVYQQQQ